MTDKQAFELMVRHTDEATLTKTRAMLHAVGVDKVIETMVESYKEQGKMVNEEFKEWMRQSYEYILSTTSN